MELRGRLAQYLTEQSGEGEWLPDEPLRFSQLDDEERALDCVVKWAADSGKQVEESYVNLVPTPRHGTHVNGLRTALPRVCGVLRVSQAVTPGCEDIPD